MTADLRLHDPVREIHAVSHDPSMQHLMLLADGRSMTALDMQRAYLEACHSYVDARVDLSADDETRSVLEEWASVIDALAQDPSQLADRLDWVAKKRLLDGYRSRDGLDWDAARLALVDLQYSDIDPERGLAVRLESAGRLRRITDEASVTWAMEHPPEDTRAYFRGECLRRFSAEVAAASWDSVIFDVPGHDALQRVPTLEPVRGTRAHVEAILDGASDAAALLEGLRGG
jgi:hypothetical protein